jgi:hypothetical protein
MPPGDSIPDPPRPFGKWLILLSAWAVGLVIWAVYVAFLVVMIFRAFGGK